MLSALWWMSWHLKQAQNNKKTTAQCWTMANTVSTKQIKFDYSSKETSIDYPVDLTDDAVQGVTLQILSKEMTRERTILQKKA
jgi:hypothetical protein